MNPDPPCVKPFFVVGPARSGTTALARLVNEAKAATCLHFEGNVLYYLWRMMNRRGVLTEPNDDLVTEFRTTVQHNLVHRAGQSSGNTTVWRPDDLDCFVSAFRKKLFEAKDPKVLFRETAEHFFRLLSVNSGVCTVGDKVPDYSHIIDVLIDILPDARFIYIMRDPRAIVHSTQCFMNGNLHLFGTQSAFAIAVSLLVRHHLMVRELTSSRRLLLLSQEDLARDPGFVAGKCAEFLHIQFCDDLAEASGSMRKNVRTKNWRQEMALDDIAAVESVFLLADDNTIKFQAISRSKQKWEIKALAIRPLVYGCSTSRIASVVSMAQSVFQSEEDLWNLGNMLVQLGDHSAARFDFNRAETFYELAKQLMPDDGALWFKLGELFISMQRLNRASEAFDMALEFMPETEYYRFLKAKTFFQKARAHRLKGNTVEAVQCYRYSHQIFPEYKLARAMLEMLES